MPQTVTQQTDSHPFLLILLSHTTQVALKLRRIHSDGDSNWAYQYVNPPSRNVTSGLHTLFTLSRVLLVHDLDII